MCTRDHARPAHRLLRRGRARVRLATARGGDLRVAGPRRAFRSLVAAGALSRASSPALAAVLPYARAGGGAGSVLSRVGVPAAAVAVVGALAATVLLLDVDGVWLAVAAVATVAGLGVTYRRWLGGVTGDCLGAAIQLTETIALLLAAGLAA